MVRLHTDHLSYYKGFSRTMTVIINHVDLILKYLLISTQIKNWREFHVKSTACSIAAYRSHTPERISGSPIVWSRFVIMATYAIRFSTNTQKKISGRFGLGDILFSALYSTLWHAVNTQFRPLIVIWIDERQAMLRVSKNVIFSTSQFRSFLVFVTIFKGPILFGSYQLSCFHPPTPRPPITCCGKFERGTPMLDRTRGRRIRQDQELRDGICYNTEYGFASVQTWCLLKRLEHHC